MASTHWTRAFDYVEATHDGYLPLVHCRSVLRLPEDLWLVVDHLIGTGRHRADIYWHFDPGLVDGESGEIGGRDSFGKTGTQLSPRPRDRSKPSRVTGKGSDGVRHDMAVSSRR